MGLLALSGESVAAFCAIDRMRYTRLDHSASFAVLRAVNFSFWPLDIILPPLSTKNKTIYDEKATIGHHIIIYLRGS